MNKIKRKFKVGDEVICNPKYGIGAYKEKLKFNGQQTTIKTGRLWSDEELNDSLITKLKMLG